VVVVKRNVMIVMSDGNVSCGECNGDGNGWIVMNVTKLFSFQYK
jgi:hypothetical protein